ncbi:MAG: C-terminal binding protein [Paracoccaceae bacterium]
MSSPAKVVRTDGEMECPGVDAALTARGVNLVLMPGGSTEDEVLHECRDADLVLMCYTPITARIIDAAERLKGIVKYGVGIDAIDIGAASSRGIPVVNVPDYAEETVAEGALALLIALARKLLPIRRAMAQEGWIWPTAEWLGSDISGKTLGLVGVGRIGRKMARMAGAGFGARVIGYNPNMPAEIMRNAGVSKYHDLHEMLAVSDFVSIHCVLNERTRGMIGEAEFRSMKPSALLINVSRGAIVDEAAMLRALREGRIAGAGLDVFGEEPLNRDRHPLAPLYDMDNVILTPHLAFYTREALARLETETLARCFEILEGRPALVKSADPRLRSQRSGVRFQD